MHTHLFRFPYVTSRLLHVWRRNGLVWRKLAIPSMLGNLADPMLYMLGLGYGLGAMVPEVRGMSYVAFLAAGTVCSSTMNTASFEAMYSGFSRMHVQKTWEAILNAPVTLDDVVLGEAVWAASKALLSGAAVLIVAAALGLVQSALALWLLPIVFVTGLAFAGLGLMITALSPSYDFFMYYFTLVITPMMLVCGVFFPREQLPLWLQHFGSALPLTHAVALSRPLMNGAVPTSIGTHVLVLVAYAVVACYAAVVLARRRLLK
ncbi:MAG: ABC transporter permease [Rhodospirillaceae bacterium]